MSNRINDEVMTFYIQSVKGQLHCDITQFTFFGTLFNALTLELHCLGEAYNREAVILVLFYFQHGCCFTILLPDPISAPSWSPNNKIAEIALDSNNTF